jgi:hypothetical protein
MEEFGKERADDSPEMISENAIHSGEELRKRRSSRIVQAVPLTVKGVDALGRPFIERTSSLIINCHGCRYQSKHYVLKNMWVTLEIPHPETGQAPRQVRGRVAWIQRPRTVRQLFQVALELELPGNVWGIGFPPEDWTSFAVPSAPAKVHALQEDEIHAVPAEKTAEHASAPGEPEMPPPAIGVDTALHVMPVPASTTDASLQLARQVARLIADAKQQISAAAREAAAHAVTAEHRTASEQWEQKFSAARSELANETGRSLERVQQKSTDWSREAQSAATKALQEELPKWLSPHLRELTRELTAALSKTGSEQRALHEQQISDAAEKVQQLCREAEEVARRIVTQAQDAERRLREHASVTSAVLEGQTKKQEDTFSAHHERLNTTASSAQQQIAEAMANAEAQLKAQFDGKVEASNAQIQEFLNNAIARLNDHTAELIGQRGEELRARLLESLSNEADQRIAALRESSQGIVIEVQQLIQSLRAELQSQAGLLDHATERAGKTAFQLDQLASQLGTTQQLAIESFQSQLDDVLTLHRNELHRRSESLFEDLNARVRRSFDEASDAAAEKFDQQVRGLVEPHINQTNEVIHRLAGGRSLLDAALTLQQDRIRNSADEAFAESLGRFRENLGGVEQLLHDASQGVITRNLAELENKAGDIRHRAGEEIYKTAEWYEKKVQTQLNTLGEKVAEQGANQLREKAGEVAAEFAAELDHSSRNFVGHTQQQMQEVVRESFDRARELFAEAADTTTAAFMDEIQRHGRQELDGYAEAVKQTSAETHREFLASRESLAQQLTTEQENFLRRFQAGMASALDSGIREAQEKITAGFGPLLESWKALSEQQQDELRARLSSLSNDATGEYKNRLENVSNTWILATVAKLDHQSRHVVSGISASAEEKLREACAQVFNNVGDSLKKRLQEITAEFGKRDS